MEQEIVRTPKEWKALVREPPTNDSLALVSTNLNTVDYLCKVVPRKGPWFNSLRRSMKLSPKQLRVILVAGRERFINSLKAK